jgi:aspartyl-tRNA(Asn)/glutamyl-tRNA(Gln) amidotransferase subunit C
MTLSRAEVEHIAELARLRLTEAEKDQFQEQLSAILDHAAVLADVDTSAIPPTATVLPLRNVMRADQARPSLPQEAVLANAPDPYDGFFRVKSILEHE